MTKHILFGLAAIVVSGLGAACTTVEADHDDRAASQTTTSTTVHERHVAPVSTGVTTTRETSVRSY